MKSVGYIWNYNQIDYWYATTSKDVIIFEDDGVS